MKRRRMPNRIKKDNITHICNTCNHSDKDSVIAGKIYCKEKLTWFHWNTICSDDSWRPIE